jgi:hypothetical protein
VRGHESPGMVRDAGFGVTLDIALVHRASATG